MEKTDAVLICPRVVETKDCLTVGLFQGAQTLKEEPSAG